MATHRPFDLRGRLAPVWVLVAVVGASLTAWLVTLARMEDMDAGPGTELGSIAWYVGVWVTMMAAMMLPSAAPMVRLYASVSRDQGPGLRDILAVAAFVAGYLAVWTGFGLLAFAVQRVIVSLESGALAWDEAGPYVAGGAVVAAGLYELTPFKRACLRHCRSPLHFLLGGWRGGLSGAVRMGGAHGLYCVGCCIGLMLILFAVGVMSLFWMVVIASVVFAEKLIPRGERLSRVLGVAFVALGIWIALAPESVPWLTDPGPSAPTMQMR